MTDNELMTVNKDAALDRMGGDTEIYDEVLVIFLEDSPTQFESISYLDNPNVSEGEVDRIVVHRVAHSLRSAAGNIGGDAMQQKASELEGIAATGSMKELASFFKELRGEYDKVVSEVEKALAENDSATA